MKTLERIFTLTFAIAFLIVCGIYIGTRYQSKENRLKMEVLEAHECQVFTFADKFHDIPTKDGLYDLRDINGNFDVGLVVSMGGNLLTFVP